MDVCRVIIGFSYGVFMSLIYGTLSSGCLKGLSRRAVRMLNGTYHRKQLGLGA